MLVIFAACHGSFHRTSDPIAARFDDSLKKRAERSTPNCARESSTPRIWSVFFCIRQTIDDIGSLWSPSFFRPPSSRHVCLGSVFLSLCCRAVFLPVAFFRFPLPLSTSASFVSRNRWPPMKIEFLENISNGGRGGGSSRSLTLPKLQEQLRLLGYKNYAGLYLRVFNSGLKFPEDCKIPPQHWQFQTKKQRRNEMSVFVSFAKCE